MEHEKMKLITGKTPNYVCRASIMGGSKGRIFKMYDTFDQMLRLSLDNGAIGTEEAIFTAISIYNSDFFTRVQMPSGDIKHYLNTIRSRKKV